MQLPSIDRNPNVRPSGVEAVSSGANRVIPTAPVNPSVSSAAQAVPGPSVIDLVNPALKRSAPNEGEPVHTSVPDPMRKRSTEDAAPKDWTIRRPAPEKTEDPPPKPMAQVLMDHLKTVWTASASAVQIEQVKNQVQPPTPNAASQVPGDLAKEVMLYQPSKVRKNEGI
ncbi:hypothetical protein [Rhodoferax sp.]|jgi:hypothetical protein|uniref:hypothetical protein n=1 Tax=Rhodoferax sp. TaxID=50421 RepID=UPI003783BFDE